MARRKVSDLDLNDIAIFVREKREAKHMTQVQAAKHAGVGLAMYKRLETGDENLHLGKVLKIVRAFGGDLMPYESR